MSSSVLIVNPEHHKSALSVVGVDVTVLASKNNANGREITLQKGEEGMGPPPHSHGWDETFYVLSGSVEFTCEDETSICTAGTLVHVPSGTVHAFSFLKGGGEMLEITERGQAVEMFQAVNDQIPPGPPDVEKLVEVLNKNGVTVHGGGA